MSILDCIISTKPGAPRITIYGKPGIGKSTLASQFPKPLFLLTEDNELPGIQALPIVNSFSDMWKNVKALLALDEFPFETIVIDSVTKLDALIIEHILDNEPPTKSGVKPSTIAAACGGYGAGFIKAQQVHRAFKGLMDKFKERGVSVIYIAHLAVVKHKSPDMDDYDIYSITMNHDKSREVYVDDVDCVLFCKLRSFTSESDSGRVIVKSTDERIIVSGINEGHVSKNRFGIPNEISMNFEALSRHIPFFNQVELINPSEEEE